ncbi:hypothetical protein B0J12DRAFT_429335 [Macrophomina phaseolina]|uniref:Uncharacterized protein n=1 Tax=Macrophomina phaseolina TaxID=35725 RepID=A0ABQ8GJN6_9PEZI|nr:hypothetical protein B0J12DRAFT_429335 [Macrophomina phaseolina]
MICVVRKQDQRARPISRHGGDDVGGLAGGARRRAAEILMGAATGSVPRRLAAGGGRRPRHRRGDRCGRIKRSGGEGAAARANDSAVQHDRAESLPGPYKFRSGWTAGMMVTGRLATAERNRGGDGDDARMGALAPATPWRPLRAAGGQRCAACAWLRASGGSSVRNKRGDRTAAHSYSYSPAGCEFEYLGVGRALHRAWQGVQGVAMLRAGRRWQFLAQGRARPGKRGRGDGETPVTVARAGCDGVEKGSRASSKPHKKIAVRGR